MSTTWRAEPSHGVSAAPAVIDSNDSRRDALRIKRLMDIVLASAALALIWPLLAVISMAIRCDGLGPAIYRQRRTGRYGAPFTILKFRTMRPHRHTGLEDVVEQCRRDDPRITPLGRYLRRYGLDELPQLINVLAGDMSLVGPRPHALSHDHSHSLLAPAYQRRFAMRPGLTGLAQVRGQRGEISCRDDLLARTQSDLSYIANWTLRGDIVLMLRTPLALAKSTTHGENRQISS